MAVQRRPNAKQERTMVSMEAKPPGPSSVQTGVTFRRLPWITILLFAIAVGIFAASFGRWRVYSSENLPAQAWSMEPRWEIDLSGGRLIASRHHVFRSFGSLPVRPSLRNLGGFSYEQQRFRALSGSVTINAWPSRNSVGAVGGTVMAEHLAVPVYPLPLSAGLLLAWRIRRTRRVSMPGCCANCGYDLRATPGRCPECGVTPDSA